MSRLVRALVFVLGLVILVDALWESPTSGVSIVVGLLLMGVISYDQIRELMRRNGASRTVHQEGDDPEAETAMGSRLQLGQDKRGKPRFGGPSS